jgi:cytochrome c553
VRTDEYTWRPIIRRFAAAAELRNAMKRTALLLACAIGSALSHAQEVKGDAKAGERKVAMCMGCHGIPGYQASFPEVHKVPMIAGQSASYIASALSAYRKGDRKHPSMRGIAGSLSDQDIADVAAFYAQQGRAEGIVVPEALHTPPQGEVAKLLQKSACTTCHGPNFNKPVDANTPKLAGQYADYLYAALKAYQTDHNPVLGRSNAIMMGMARPFTHPEIKALAQYISSLPGDLKTVAQSRFR